MTSPSASRKQARRAVQSKDGQNIKVFVRCRPLNSMEKNSKSFSCVECQNNKELIIKERPLDKYTKTFAFDRVFGPDSKQIDVYKAVAKNSVEEVLNGFNCTIFAYGQTGTGKTFTMEGERTPDTTSWDEDPMAGIIPRCVNHLFDELRLQKLEFTMRVSFLELYNEELFDLLSPHDDMSKLRLYEDATRKGSCIIQGLEEVLVRSKANVYEVLEKGSNKRQTAATLMNAHSSRSHTVFTVTLHIKENTVDGDELLKTGKLHLVDLAGSENIGRSGAVDKRAREAGNINMSLLTLGRVITALVEKTPHIPYRESKLTRLLQDALGGRTKTSIIATVSPASVNLEETLSTLDYAHRAKNITNKPEVNQKLNKKELIGEYSQEIERLRLDLMAMREKSGVYLANENYQEMIHTMETQATEITEKINYIRGLEEGIETKSNELNTATTKMDGLCLQLDDMKSVLTKTKEMLCCTQKLLHQTSVQCDEQKYLVSAHVKNENKLLNQGKVLVDLADTTTGDLTKLHQKLDRKKNVENSNLDLGKKFQTSYSKSVDSMKSEINSTVIQQKKALNGVSMQFDGSVKQCRNEVSSIVSQWKEVCQNHASLFKALHKQYKTKTEKDLSSTKNFSECRSQESQNQKAHMKGFEQTLFLPAMEKLAALISAEAVMMSSMHEAVNGKLTELNVKWDGFVKQQNQLITDHEAKMKKLLTSFTADTSACRTSFETLYKSVNTKAKALDSKCIEMQALVSSIQEIKQSIKGDIDNTNSTLPASLRCLEEMAKSAKGQLKEFTKGHNENTTSNVSFIKSFVSDVQATVEKYNGESEQNVQHLGEERCGLESMMCRHVSETNTFLDSIASNMIIYKESAEKSAEKSIKDNSAHVEKTITNIECDRERLVKVLESEYLRLEQDLSSLKSECSVISTNLQKQMDSHSDHLSNQKIEVLELFSERMVKDFPTGETPVRQDYKFSRILSSTSPHDIILDRYRAGTASTMSRVPLPNYEDDTEDEVSSPSFESSRLSASDNSHIEEDTSETKSLSGSVSDVHSNSGSTTDIVSQLNSRSKNVNDRFLVPSRPVPNSRENSSLSRSSSTSSLPDVKDKQDKENKISVQRGSNKKRGLKQPSSITEKTHGQETLTRTRRVLGTQN